MTSKNLIHFTTTKNLNTIKSISIFHNLTQKERIDRINSIPLHIPQKG